MENVITNPEQQVSETGQVPLDLSKSNAIRVLLDERSNLAEFLRAAKDRIDDIDLIIKGVMADHEIGELPGWSIRFETVQRKPFFVEAGTYRRLVIKQTGEG